MGSVIQLKTKINNAYLDLRSSVEDKIELVEDKIRNKLKSDVSLVEKMTNYNLNTGGKRLRALITLGSAKLCGYSKGGRDVNLAACVELIHAATLMHDDVLDNGEIRRGKKTPRSIWGNNASILVGDYLLSRCFEMMVEDGNIEFLKLYQILEIFALFIFVSHLKILLLTNSILITFFSSLDNFGLGLGFKEPSSQPDLFTYSHISASKSA